MNFSFITSGPGLFSSVLAYLYKCTGRANVLHGVSIGISDGAGVSVSKC